MSNYIHTYTGKRVYLPGADASMIDIVDIAHALSKAPRFAGHLDVFLSVAEHSLTVAKIVQELGGSLEDQLQGLLHDATEAYLCDIPTPFKVLIPGYKDLEDDIWQAVCSKFSIDTQMSPLVKRADQIALMSERDTYKSAFDDWGDLEKVERVGLDLVPFTQHDAKDAFYNAFLALTSRRNNDG